MIQIGEVGQRVVGLGSQTDRQTDKRTQSDQKHWSQPPLLKMTTTKRTKHQLRFKTMVLFAATINLGIGASCDEINERRYCARHLVCHKCVGDSYYTCVQCMYSPSMYHPLSSFSFSYFFLLFCIHFFLCPRTLLENIVSSFIPMASNCSVFFSWSGRKIFVFWFQTPPLWCGFSFSYSVQNLPSPGHT